MTGSKAQQALALLSTVPFADRTDAIHKAIELVSGAVIEHDEAMETLRMVDTNNRIDDGERGLKAWHGPFVISEVRRVVEGRPRPPLPRSPS